MAPMSRLALAVAVSLACFAGATPAATAPKPTLAHFASETELKDWLEKLRKRYDEERRKRDAQRSAMGSSVMSQLASPAAPAALAKEEAVTNVQTQGVDEGGIVKVHGEHLVVLRRGRLFTVGIANGGLAKGAVSDAFDGAVDPGGTWYDEMLIHGDTIVVIGFSYARGGTEIGLFDIDAAGKLSYRATYQLRSNDYYSSRNYASRLIGDKLVFYTPLYIRPDDPYGSFPAMRRWHGDPKGAFKPIAPATRIYRTADALDLSWPTLHTVTVCDLGKREMECEATGVLGSPSRSFYVSQGSVYVWSSGVYRIPLDGSAPTALKVVGMPIDQMSFLESDDGHLNVLLRSDGRGDAMWGAEKGGGASMALLRVPLGLFGNGRDSAPPSAYRRVPAALGWNIQNRYVGPYLLYGAGATWGPANANGRYALNALRWAQNGTVQTISLPHGVDRIEALGRNAIVVGTSGKDLHFSSVRLAEDASIPYRYTRPDAAQGETRTHGFFYKPDGDETGIVGLPVVAGGRPGYKQLREGSAAVAFLRNDALALRELGDLASKPVAGESDNCRASCVDWYGNARPLFLRNRVFALMGYEIVEGRVNGRGIEELRRVDFTPR